MKKMENVKIYFSTEEKTKCPAINSGQCSHHAATEMRLDLLRLELPDLQHVQLGLGALQHPFAVQHALLKISRLLEQLVLCGDLSQLSLQSRKKGGKKKVGKILLPADSSLISSTVLIIFPNRNEQNQHFFEEFILNFCG